MNNRITLVLVALLFPLLTACSFLDPLPDGTITEENYDSFPTIIQGYVFKAYDNLPMSYKSDAFIGLDACTDDAVLTNNADLMRQFSIGNAQMSSYPLSKVWKKDYEAINYVNLFLKDDIGLNTRYLLEPSDNAKLQRYLQGDAYGLRAWFLFDLLRTFAGKDADGQLLGVPIFTQPNDLNDFDPSKIVRASYDDCIRQILNDCDEALKYLPEANRDFVVSPTSALIDGAARYRGLDCVSIRALKALVYLTWASPAFNPSGDRSRWESAARMAMEVIRYKLDVEGVQSNGFNPVTPYYFTYHNDPEVIWTSSWQHNSYETMFYPLGFGGTAEVVPTQELVDAFGMANGYPISDARSNYDPAAPYSGRDPRFYSVINTHGSKVLRGGDASDVMYTFDVAEGGADAPGLMSTSTTGYYIKKYIYNLWNPYDKTIQTIGTSIFFLRWTQMCLAFAEAANHAVGPTSTAFGLSAKEALAYVRNRTTQDLMAGVGASGDPYLEECAAAGETAFDALVKNEWRIETCFEGARFFHLRRWGATAAQVSIPVHGVRISGGEGGNTFRYETIETKSFPSPWLPIPYLEVRKCGQLVQNAGWETWK